MNYIFYTIQEKNPDDVKLYNVLNGLMRLRNARLNFRQQEETHIMENIIYNELIIRGYSVDVGVVEIIEKNNGKKRRKQCEIDFVVIWVQRDIIFSLHCLLMILTR